MSNMISEIQVQNLNEAVCITLWADVLRQGIYLSVLIPAMGKYKDRINNWYGNLFRRRKTEFQPAFLLLKLTLCHTLFEEEGLGTYIYWWRSCCNDNRVQILNKVVCISHSTNTLWKGMNPTILPPAMSDLVGWGCRIHRLHLCRGEKLPQRVSWIWN